MDALFSTGHLVWVLVAIVIVAAWPYSQLVKHERHAPLAAFLLFTGVLILAAAALYLVIIVLVTAFGLAAYLHSWLAAIIIIALILVPAVLLARRIVGRPPRKERP